MGVLEAVERVLEVEGHDGLADGALGLQEAHIINLILLPLGQAEHALIRVLVLAHDAGGHEGHVFDAEAGFGGIVELGLVGEAHGLVINRALYLEFREFDFLGDGIVIHGRPGCGRVRGLRIIIIAGNYSPVTQCVIADLQGNHVGADVEGTEEFVGDGRVVDYDYVRRGLHHRMTQKHLFILQTHDLLLLEKQFLHRCRRI